MIITKPHVNSPYMGIIKKQRPAGPIMLALLLVPLFFLVHRYRHSLTPSLYLKPCGHSVVITAARHGSTWFITCAEGCPPSAKGTFSIPNFRTELWVEHSGRRDILRDISPESAVDYLRHNMSLKIMRVTANREEELRKFFRGLDDSTPVFMLRRNLKDAYNSLEQAKKTGAWRRNRIKLEDRMSNRNVVKDDMYYAYESSMTKYFEKLERLMRDEGVVWDEIDYDEASMSKTIVAKKQGCYITNCNYL